MLHPDDPASMVANLEAKRDWWMMTALAAKQAEQYHLETLALEVASMFEETLSRVRDVEAQMEAKLRDLFWRHHGHSTTHPAR